MEEVKEKKVKWVEAHELPEGEKVYLKKDFIGWRVVDPWKDEQGRINWFNLLLGGKRNLYMLIGILALVGLLYLGIDELISNYKIIAEAPCDFCSQCRQTITNLSQLNFTFPKLS